MCAKHDKLLELFCKTDQMCVCMFCTVLDHNTHEFVPLKEEYEGKKTELGKTEADVQQMIQKRQLKIQEIKRSVKLSEDAADREIAHGVQVFIALKESVEKSQAEFIKAIKEQQRKTVKQAEDFIKDLEQEISELKKRRSEVEQLLHCEDHLYLLQSFSSLKVSPPTKDWTKVKVQPPSYEGTVVRVVAQLEQMINEPMKKLFEAELKRVQQYAVDVTLDPDVVHPRPAQSNDGEQSQKQIDPCRCVFSKRGFSSGRFYFQAEVNKWSTWTFGVARKTFTLSPRNGFWTVCSKSSGEYFVPDDPPVRLSLKQKPEKVGVFVHYEQGVVSFYDVDAAAPIYSFTGCSFPGTIYPYFSPCPNNGFSCKRHKRCVLQ